MSAKTRFILILAAAAVIFDSLLTWFLISFNPRRGHSGYLTFFIIFILAVAPIYPLCKGLTKRPLSSALGILLVIASGICTFASVTAALVPDLGTGWAYAAANLSFGLGIGSCVLFAWSAFVQKNQQ